MEYLPKSKGGTKGEKTKPRKLIPLYLVNVEGKEMDYYSKTRIEFVEELPMTTTGKIIRKKLREQNIYS